jgi:hypothetical protein
LERDYEQLNLALDQRTFQGRSRPFCTLFHQLAILKVRISSRPFSVILNRDSLASKVVREVIGERVVNLSEQYTSENVQAGLLSQIFNLGARQAF